MAETEKTRARLPMPSGTSRLRFPKLLVLVLLLFLIDLLVPDFIPMVDELILGVLSLILALLRKPRKDPASSQGPD